LLLVPLVKNGQLLNLPESENDHTASINL
jgi:hypothetical protein